LTARTHHPAGRARGRREPRRSRPAGGTWPIGPPTSTVSCGSAVLDERVALVEDELAATQQPSPATSPGRRRPVGDVVTLDFGDGTRGVFCSARSTRPARVSTSSRPNSPTRAGVCAEPGPARRSPTPPGQTAPSRQRSSPSAETGRRSCGCVRRCRVHVNAIGVRVPRDVTSGYEPLGRSRGGRGAGVWPVWRWPTVTPPIVPPRRPAEVRRSERTPGDRRQRSPGRR